MLHHTHTCHVNMLGRMFQSLVICEHIRAKKLPHLLIFHYQPRLSHILKYNSFYTSNTLHNTACCFAIPCNVWKSRSVHGHRQVMTPGYWWNMNVTGGRSTAPTALSLKSKWTNISVMLFFVLVTWWCGYLVHWSRQEVRGHLNRGKAWSFPWSWICGYSCEMTNTLGFLSPLQLFLKGPRWVWPFHIQCLPVHSHVHAVALRTD